MYFVFLFEYVLSLLKICINCAKIAIDDYTFSIVVSRKLRLGLMLTLDKEKTLFLLGRYDWEMCTIRNLLDLSQFHYVDNHLHWNNAKLSGYRNEIERFLIDDVLMSIYGIELENDIFCTDSRYHLIDHHNAMSKFSSVLEQVMTLLQFPMNRYCQLVDANDKRYIPEMLAMGTINEEIDMIRRSDRMAQGITKEDERLAEKAISENSVRVGDLLVKVLTSRFAPIVTMFFFINLIQLMSGRIMGNG